MPLDRGNTNDSKYPWVMEKGFEKEVNVPRDFFLRDGQGFCGSRR